MGIDAGWHARKPGLIPPALVRAAVEKAKALCAPLTLTMSEDFGEYGGEADVDCADYGPISLYQPEEEDDTFSVFISTNSGASYDDFDVIFAVADAIATSLGCGYDDAGPLDEVREELEQKEKAKDTVEVRSVRVEIGLSGPATPSPLVVALEGKPLAVLRGDQIEELEQSVSRAVAWAVEDSSRAEGKPTLDELVVWLASRAEEVKRPKENAAHLQCEELEGVMTLRVRDDDIDLFFWPDIDLEPSRALTLNDSSLQVAALALDGDGDWLVRSSRPRLGMSPRALLAWFDAFVGDVERVFDSDGEEDSDDEEDGDDDEGSDDEGDEG